MSKKIYVLSRYNNESLTGQDRVCFLSGMMKLDYIMDSLKECGYSIELISASNARKNTIYSSKKVRIDEMTNLHLIPGLCIKTKLGIVITNVFFRFYFSFVFYS